MGTVATWETVEIASATIAMQAVIPSLVTASTAVAVRTAMIPMLNHWQRKRLSTRKPLKKLLKKPRDSQGSSRNKWRDRDPIENEY